MTSGQQILPWPGTSVTLPRNSILDGNKPGQSPPTSMTWLQTQNVFKDSSTTLNNCGSIFNTQIHKTKKTDLLSDNEWFKGEWDTGLWYILICLENLILIVLNPHATAISL